MLFKKRVFERGRDFKLYQEEVDRLIAEEVARNNERNLLLEQHVKRILNNFNNDKINMICAVAMYNLMLCCAENTIDKLEGKVKLSPFEESEDSFVVLKSMFDRYICHERERKIVINEQIIKVAKEIMAERKNEKTSGT